MDNFWFIWKWKINSFYWIEKRGAIAKDFLIWRGLLQTILREVKRAAAALSQNQKDENCYNKIIIGNVYKELKKNSDIKDVIRNQKLLTNVISQLTNLILKFHTVRIRNGRTLLVFHMKSKLTKNVSKFLYKLTK